MDNRGLHSLLTQAKELFEMCQYEESLDLYTKLVKSAPNNCDCLDGYALLLMELGDLEKAKEVYTKSIKLKPLESHEKYMNLGQILTGKDSVECFKRGIEILRKEREKMKNAKKHNKVKRLDRDISNGYCSIVEIYLSDLCFEDNAEKMCEQCLDLAKDFDSQNPEVYQLLASVRISQNKQAEAKKLLDFSFNLWQHLLPTDNDEEEKMNDNVELPSFDFRTSTAKMFIELKDFEKAIKVLATLVQEHDGVAELWYLLGLAYCQHNPLLHKEKAIEALLTADDLIKNFLATENDSMVAEMGKEVKELLNIVGYKKEDEEDEEEEAEFDENDNNNDDDDDDDDNDDNNDNNGGTKIPEINMLG